LRRLEITPAGRANRSGITAANEAEPVCGVRGSFELPEAGVHDHLSKDGVIDASTCLLPENTWFIKDSCS